MEINQKRPYLKYFLIILSIFLIANIINFLRSDSAKTLNLTINKSHLTEANYTYSSSNVHKITFVFYYSHGDDIVQDELGTYELNNFLGFHNFDPFNLLNHLAGKDKDKGVINLSLMNEDNCVYLDCYSSKDASQPTTISEVNLQEGISFDDYQFKFESNKKLEDKNVYTVLEGSTENNDSKIQIYLIYE